MHIWSNLVEHIESAGNFNPNETIIARDVRIIKSLEPNYFFDINILPADEKNTTFYLEYIERLNQDDLDIDREKGRAVFERLIEKNIPPEPFEERVLYHGGPQPKP